MKFEKVPSAFFAIVSWSAFISVYLCGLPTPAWAMPPADPNIVVIMGDDWSWPHAGILGDPVAKTPTFDRIAREGVLFENAFVSSPSCTPSRFAFVTGQYHWRLGSGDSLGGSLAADVPVYPELLAKAGYLTGFSRKGAAPSKHEFRGNDPFGKRYKNFDDFLSERKSGQPFCFWYGAGEPHRPYDWQASLKSDIDLDAINVPACLPENQTVRTDLGDYYLRIQKLDRLAGQIVAQLEKLGELENTVVIMAGDNGMPFPRCKATLYDTGTRVPLAIRWGGNTTAGLRISDFFSLIDLAPTILEIAGVEIPEPMTGRSLLKHMKAKTSGQIEADWDQVLIGREKHVLAQPCRAIRTKKFLYIRNFAPASWPSGESKVEPQHYDFSKTPWPTKPPAFSFDVDPSPTKQWMREHSKDPEARRLSELAFGQRPEEELYDLAKDPDQMVNVADEGKYAEHRTRLSNQLTRRLRETGDPRFKLNNHATFSVKGWRVHLNDQLWRDEPAKTKRMLELLAVQLDRVVAVVPAKSLKQIRKVPIWINPIYDGVRPTAEFHPNAGWLRDNGRNPAMEKCVELTNVLNYEFENKRMPMMMLHELAHAYHNLVLGFRNPKVRAAFEAAKDSGDYDEVDRFTGRKMTKDKAYAITNEKEYFAESSEAYFGKNDFFPFDRAELKQHDSAMHDLLVELWGDQ